MEPEIEKVTFHLTKDIAWWSIQQIVVKREKNFRPFKFFIPTQMQILPQD